MAVKPMTETEIALRNVTGPGVGMVAVTPSTTDFPTPCTLYASVGGTVTATGLDGAEFTVAIPTGTELRVLVTKVTDATGSGVSIFRITR